MLLRRKHCLLPILFVVSMLFSTTSQSDTESAKFMPPILYLLQEDTSPVRIFVLGASTVHAADYISGDFNDPFGSDRALHGWAEQLGHYMKDPAKLENRARAGADSVQYRTPHVNDATNDGLRGRHWIATEELITASEDGRGGFLLIQFGSNDAHHDIGEQVFETQLEAYIADAKRLKLTPVLISPPNSRNRHHSRAYEPLIEPVADRNNVLFLDLHQKSMDVWSTYDINEDYDGDGAPDNVFFETLPEADIIYAYLEYHHGINNSHLSPIGANKVAGWVKELACQSTEADGKRLCNQFKPPVVEGMVVVREDAGDSDTIDWEAYSTTDNTTISNIYDEGKQSRVIELSGDAGTNNGFRLNQNNPWNETENFVISWSMKYNEDFSFFVGADVDNVFTIFEYQPTANPGEITANGRYRFGLGTAAANDTWQTFTRDIAADLNALSPGRTLQRIHRIALRGSGRVDDIKTMRSLNADGNSVPPVVSLVGRSTIIVPINTNYADAGAKAADDVDDNISDDIITVNPVDTQVAGSYTVIYKSHDSTGNGAFTTRTVNVVDQ